MRLIAKYIGFPIQDYVKKTSILPTLRFLLESQYWDEEQMYHYRLKKLQRLVQYAYRHVQYYTELFNNHDIMPDDIKTLDDIEKIPILTKELARANQHKLISDIVNVRTVKKGKTGGTTGSPLIVYKDTNDRTFTWASYYRWYDWMGIKKEDKAITLWGERAVLKSSIKGIVYQNIKDWIQNNKIISAFSLNEMTLPSVYEEIMKYNPILIKGYLSALILIAKFMQSNNLPHNQNLLAISSTTETLLPMYRALLEKVFCVPVYDQYGCGENSAISYECGKHHGLHVNEEHVIVECLDDNDDHVIEKRGRLIITSLDNFVMPFIRYENGDEATLHKAKCLCGVKSQLMSSINGRTTDTITLKDGSKVHGVFFTDILFEMGITTDLISRFQIYQYSSGAIDFILETKNKISEKLLHDLESESLRFLKSVNIKLVEFIPNEPNGKFKYIKSQMH